MNILPVYIGYDSRQAIAYNVLQFSILRRSSRPIALHPLVLESLPLTRRGLTPFTFSRFLVPWLQEYRGWAMFLDIDMLVLGDIADLFEQANPRCAAMVVKNRQRFEWASVILFNCAHPSNRRLIPAFVENPLECRNPHALDWLAEEEIGALPTAWNHLVGYDPRRSDAKIVHFTQGMPIFEETLGSEYRDQWMAEHEIANSTQPWPQLMAKSVHAGMTREGRPVARLHPDALPTT
ncbi:MAG TPA: hypothetical protein VHL08_02360 [Dongiaceae bacterium]|jgi:lipopolysaccharide biosynthesis glycosyltransferase|nr:hypothetical protein [Dongiaceae bacterium]